jgi:UDP-3-O-[3-hydroxymyristoyl] N-acetylglucosamine deacetylase
MQTTIKQSTVISGIGLHSGSAVNITLKPTEPDRGIVFTTSNGRAIGARFDNLV